MIFALLVTKKPKLVWTEDGLKFAWSHKSEMNYDILITSTSRLAVLLLQSGTWLKSLNTVR